MTAGERPGFMARIRRRPTAPAGDPVLVGQFVATPGAAVDQVVPQLNAHVPAGDPLTAWDRRCAEYRLVSPANRRKFTVIVVGTGLAGAGAAAALGNGARPRNRSIQPVGGHLRTLYERPMER